MHTLFQQQFILYEKIQGTYLGCAASLACRKAWWSQCRIKTIGAKSSCIPYNQKENYILSNILEFSNSVLLSAFNMDYILISIYSILKQMENHCILKQHSINEFITEHLHLALFRTLSFGLKNTIVNNNSSTMKKNQSHWGFHGGSRLVPNQ